MPITFLAALVLYPSFMESTCALGILLGGYRTLAAVEQHKAALKDRGAQSKFVCANNGKQAQLVSGGRRRKLLSSNARP